MTQPQTFLIDWLIQNFPKSSRTTLRRMVEHGRVSINGRRAIKITTPLSPTDRVDVADRAPTVDVSQTLYPLSLVFEDADLLVIDKPAGLLTSSGARDKRATALAIVEQYLKPTNRRPTAERVGLIHRLDRDASGLLVFSKNQEAYESLKAQFYRHTVGRVYDAIIHGVPTAAAGVIDAMLVESVTGKVFITRDDAKGRPARTDYRVVGPAGLVGVAGGGTRLVVTLHTGRKHQIRAHLASVGHPIVGDTLYGPKPPAASTLQLRAIELALNHPRTTKRLTWTASPLTTATKLSK